MMVRMYRMVLGPHYELAFAADGAEGLDAAARDPGVDGMVVDINMPGMDGLEFVRRLRGELGMTAVPVLVCSTEAADADQQAARDGGGRTGFSPSPGSPRSCWPRSPPGWTRRRDHALRTRGRRGVRHSRRARARGAASAAAHPRAVPPAGVRGVAQVRGTVMAVVDLGARLGMAPVGPARGGWWWCGGAGARPWACWWRAWWDWWTGGGGATRPPPTRQRRRCRPDGWPASPCRRPGAAWRCCTWNESWAKRRDERVGMVRRHAGAQQDPAGLRARAALMAVIAAAVAAQGRRVAGLDAESQRAENVRRAAVQLEIGHRRPHAGVPRLSAQRAGHGAGHVRRGRRPRGRYRTRPGAWCATTQSARLDSVVRLAAAG